jgi:rubrerythrin
MKVDLAIDAVQSAEADLAKELRLLAEHHAADHDVYHLGHTRARQCVRHVQQLAEFANSYDGERLDAEDATSVSIIEALRRRASTALGRSDVAGLLLADDLRDVYLTAQRTEIAWVVLEQTAKAIRDAALLELVQQCHEQTQQTATWLRSRIKESAAQVYATS